MANPYKRLPRYHKLALGTFIILRALVWFTSSLHQIRHWFAVASKAHHTSFDLGLGHVVWAHPDDVWSLALSFLSHIPSASCWLLLFAAINSVFVPVGRQAYEMEVVLVPPPPRHFFWVHYLRLVFYFVKTSQCVCCCFFKFDVNWVDNVTMLPGATLSTENKTSWQQFWCITGCVNWQ